MSVINPTHPGEILREDFLKPMKLSAYRLAKSINVPVNRITGIVNEERNISPETALLLARFFGVSDNLWMNLQQHYDMERAKDALTHKLKTIRTWQEVGGNEAHP